MSCESKLNCTLDKTHMIFDALSLIETELKNYIEIKGGGVFSPPYAQLGNVASIDSGSTGQNLSDSLVISLVNLEEERTLKNVRSYSKSPITGNLELYNPPINLNLYILFSANFESNYEQSLMMLGLVIRFFQGKPVLTLSNSSGNAIGTEDENLRIIFNLYTLTFEQLNHLWGSLGGKQLPSVLYRVWLVEEKELQPKRSGVPIQDIQSSEQIN